MIFSLGRLVDLVGDEGGIKREGAVGVLQVVF